MLVDNFIRVKEDELHPREWYKLKKRLTFYPKPGEKAWVWRENRRTGELWLPRGILEEMPKHLLEDFRDKRSFPKLPKLEHSIILDYVDEERMFVGQKEALAAMRERKQGIIRRQPGCIAAGTIVEINRAGKSFKMPIEQVVEKFNGEGKWAWSPEIRTMIRSRFEDGTIRLAQLDSALESGVKTVYRLTTHTGRTIDATLDHPFLTPDGWAKLGEIYPGDDVFVDFGQTQNGRQSKPRYYVVTSLWSHPYTASRGRVPYHRLVVEAEMNGMGVDEFIEYLRKPDAYIGEMTFLDPVMKVHHVDGDTTNNQRGNLMVLDSQAEHNRIHESHMRGYAVTGTETVVSVKKVGRRYTYDLALDDEPHNFFANGFVVHNTGKTNIALAAVAEFGTRTLVLVHTEDILQQWKKYAEERIPDLEIGIIRGRSREVGQLTIATVQTMIRYLWDEKFWRLFGMTIMDECHHVGAKSFESILGQTTSRYRFGLSANEKRADNMEPVMEMLIGPVIHNLEFSSPVPVTVEPLKSKFSSNYRPGGPPNLSRIKWQNMATRLVEDSDRNKLIADRVDKALDDGRVVLLLSQRTEHLALIQEKMRHDAVILAASGDFKKTKKQRKELLDLFRKGKIKCVLATQLADEALDVPILNTIVLAFPTKFRDLLLQRVGRALRSYKGKHDALIIDVIDDRVANLRRNWWERRKYYRKWGFDIKTSNPAGIVVTKLKRRAKIQKATRQRKKALAKSRAS